MQNGVRRLLPLAILALLAQAAWAGDALTFFNNWFVTGDYAVGGVGLRGTGKNGMATGKIVMPALPPQSDPIAAFLFWSTSEPTTNPAAKGGSFNGHHIQGDVLGNPNSPNPSCGSNGAFGPAGTAAQVYRADVLRYLPVNSNNIRQFTPGGETVTLPDSGGGGNGNLLYTNGASLVVIYRIVVPGFPLATPLRAVVIYNGAFTMNKNSAPMTLNVAGFYQASANAAARVTGVAANGQAGFVSPFSVNGKTLDTDPFDGALGQRWDNPSYNFSLSANASSFPTMTTASNSACLTWAAVVASTNVQDTDHDGLLDSWETSGLYRDTTASPAAFGTCADAAKAGKSCVNLKAMNANPNMQDMFIQIDWMYSDGSNPANPAHNHIPPLSSLSTVAATFALHQINVHFDVGNNYQGAQQGYCNAQCSFIVPAAYAQARPVPDGNGINEAELACKGQNCAYPNLPYPALSFEYGFASVRDGNSALTIPAHFSQDRHWVFRYGLFAHALAGPYNAQGQPISPFTGLPLQSPNILPFSYSGISNLPGGGFMVTFGLWPSQIPSFDKVGSPPEVAQTLMHEVGHGLGLHHAGLADSPNCIPNYPSIMNYLYQIRGLTDATGNEQADFSYGLLLPLSENLLTTSIPMALPGLQHYKVRYYGPLAPGEAASQAAAAHCDGSPITNGENVVKLEGLTVSTPDWSNGNVTLGKLIPPVDLNDDGKTGQLFLDNPDWLVIDLQHIGDGDNFGGFSVGSLVSDSGSLLSDAGSLLSDSGSLISDSGSFANTGAVFSASAGSLISDSGSLLSDAGELDSNTVQCSGMPPPTAVTATLGTNQNGIGNSIVITLVPPATGSNLTYNLYRCTGAGCPITQSTPIFKSFVPGQYTLTTSPIAPFTTTVSFTADTVNDTNYGGTACPAGDTCPNTRYVYLVTAQATLQCAGVNSTVNSQVPDSTPTSAIEVPEQFVVPTTATVTYDGNPHTVAFQIFGDVAGALTPAQVTCTTERNANALNTSYQVSGTGGNGQITCSNSTPPTPATEGVIYVASGLTYTDAAGVHTGGTLTINQRPITVTAAANSKTYEGTTSAAAIPTITTGTLGTGDSPSFSETYALSPPSLSPPYVGTGLTMMPSGVVNDGNSGNNYKVTFVNSQNGVIITRPVTAALTAKNKPYDTTNTEPNSNMSCALSNTVAGDSVACGASNGTFNSNQVTAATTVTATATLSGTAATNYTFGAAGTAVNSTLVNASANITTLPLTATLTSAPSKVYDGTTTETNPMTCSVATVLSPDVLSCAATNGNFNTSQVATPNLVTATATISGTAVSNYTLGAGLTTVSVTSTSVSVASSITTKAVTATLTAQSKRYDGTTTEPNNYMSCSLNNAVPGDVTSGNVTCTASNGTFNSSQVASATTVNATATLGGSAATNYTFGANGTAVNSTGVMANPVSITQAPLIITASSASIAYGSPIVITAIFNALVNNENSSVLGLGFGCVTSYVPGNPTGNVGNYPTACSGAVDSNYSISYVGGMVIVSPAQLTVTATGVNKSFDGTTNATVTLTDNRLTGPSFAADTFTDASTSASFANIGPANGITVNVTGISISGTGATNYTLTSMTGTTAANIGDSIDLSALSLNGVNYTPTWNGSVLQLTNSTGETTSAWLPAAIPVSSAFTTTFQFQITPATHGPNSIGDGFAFVIQGAPTGNTTLGSTGLGQYIGYAGIPNSIAIEFDTYYNSDYGDPTPTATSDAHVGIQSLGALANTSDHATPGASLGVPTLYNFADGGQHTATITYDGLSTITVYIDGNSVVTGTLTAPLGTFLGLSSGAAYIGFTGATGGAQEADILGSSWTWDFSVIPPPPHP